MTNILSESFIKRFNTPELRKKYMADSVQLLANYVNSRKFAITAMFHKIVSEGLPYGMATEITLHVHNKPQGNAEKTAKSEHDFKVPDYIQNHAQAISKTIKGWHTLSYGGDHIFVTQSLDDLVVKVEITYKQPQKGNIPETINLPKIEIGKSSLPEFYAICSNNNVDGHVKDRLTCLQLTNHPSYDWAREEFAMFQFTTSEGGPRVDLRVGRDIDITKTHGYLVNLVRPGAGGVVSNLFEHVCEDKIDNHSLPRELKGFLKILKSSRMEKISALCSNLEILSKTPSCYMQVREVAAHILSLLIVGYEANVFLRYNSGPLAQMCSFVDRLAERYRIKTDVQMITEACLILSRLYHRQETYSNYTPAPYNPLKFNQAIGQLLTQLHLIDPDQYKSKMLLPTFFGRVVGKIMDKE